MEGRARSAPYFLLMILKRRGERRLRALSAANPQMIKNVFSVLVLKIWRILKSPQNVSLQLAEYSIVF
jgi:hypothetical protein